MKMNLIMGMIAGSLIGATAVAIAMPYVEPRIKKAMGRGRQVINTHLDKMESGS